MNGWCEFSHAALRPQWPMAPAQPQAITAPRRPAHRLMRGVPGAWAAGSPLRLDGCGRGEAVYVRFANASGVHAASARALA